jgi:hypothetical protein
MSFLASTALNSAWTASFTMLLLCIGAALVAMANFKS